MAAPSFVNNGAIASSASATTLTPALNATRTNNNILFSFIIVNGGGKTPTTATAGWTVGDSNNTGSSSAAWAWRIVDGTETAATWTWTGAAACTGFVVQYTGNATVSPIDATAKQTGTTSTINYSGVTTATANDCIIQYGSTVGVNVIAGTPPVNYSLRVAANAGGNGNGRLSDGVIFDPGPAQSGGSSTNTNASTGAPQAANWNTFTIALKGTGTTLGSWVRATQATLQILRTVQGSAETPFVRSPDPQNFIPVNRVRAPDWFAWSTFTPSPPVPSLGWFFPLSEPVRRVSTRNLVTEPVFILPIPVVVEGMAWFMPFQNQPLLVRITEYVEQPVFTWPVPEQGMAWFMPFQNPVRVPSVAEYAEQPAWVRPNYDLSITINAVEAPDQGSIILQPFNEAVKVKIGYGKPN